MTVSGAQTSWRNLRKEGDHRIPRLRRNVPDVPPTFLSSVSQLNSCSNCSFNLISTRWGNSLNSYLSNDKTIRLLQVTVRPVLRGRAARTSFSPSSGKLTCGKRSHHDATRPMENAAIRSLTKVTECSWAFTHSNLPLCDTDVTNLETVICSGV